MEFSIDFRTTYEDGIIFYVDDERHSDFMALYMKGGKLVFGYNCGSGIATIPTNNFYNDGHWHTVSGIFVDFAKLLTNILTTDKKSLI